MTFQRGYTLWAFSNEIQLFQLQNSRLPVNWITLENARGDITELTVRDVVSLTRHLSSVYHPTLLYLARPLPLRDILSFRR